MSGKMSECKITIKRNIKRVMLVYPNQHWYKHDLTTTWNLSPYTLCLLGGLIKDKYEVKIVDAQFYDMSEEEFKKEVEYYQPDCVGISVLTSEYASILDTAAGIIKNIDKSIITVAGGVHATMQHHRIMENVDIDFAIRGEGEYVFRQLIDYLNGDGEFPKKGIVFRGGDGVVNALTPDLIQDLDALPLPDYDLVDYESYINSGPRYGVDSIHIFPYARILTSRGCTIFFFSSYFS
jgi:anaerobic magnesium-protoporphyrin IX monomethyl ester cyclase